MPAYILNTVAAFNTDNSGADFSANMPGTFAAGNLLIGFTRARAAAETFTTPAGWTSLVTFGGTAGSGAVFAKIAAGGDSPPTISWSGATNVVCNIAAFSGDVYTDLSTIVVNSATSISANSTNIIVPALTVTQANCLIVGGGGHTKTVTSDGSTVTLTGDYTQLNQVNANGSTQNAAWGYVQQTAATNMVQDTWTIAAENLARSGFSISLQTSSTPPGPVLPVPPGAKQTFVNDIYLQF